MPAVVQDAQPSSTTNLSTEEMQQSLKKKDSIIPPSSASASPKKAMPSLIADDVSGSALRLLHALVAASSGGEALARCTPPAVPILVGALQWGGAAAVLAVETLKRGLSTSNRSRDLLVGSALNTGLLTLLLNKLDWRSRRVSGEGISLFSTSPGGGGSSGGGGSAHDGSAAAAASVAGDEASDEAVQRVLFVDVINLMALEGQYANQVRSVLDVSEIWAAYRGQRHDLFLPSGGTATHGVVGLLKGPEKARFALPAPEPASAAGVEVGEQEQGLSSIDPGVKTVAGEGTVIIPTPPSDDDAGLGEMAGMRGIEADVKVFGSPEEEPLLGGAGFNAEESTYSEFVAGGTTAGDVSAGINSEENTRTAVSDKNNNVAAVLAESQFPKETSPHLNTSTNTSCALPINERDLVQPAVVVDSSASDPLSAGTTSPSPRLAAATIPRVAPSARPPQVTDKPKEVPAALSPQKAPSQVPAAAPAAPAAAPGSSSPAQNQELSPTKAFIDPLSALGSFNGGDNSD